MRRQEELRKEEEAACNDTNYKLFIHPLVQIGLKMSVTEGVVVEKVALAGIGIARIQYQQGAIIRGNVIYTRP